MGFLDWLFGTEPEKAETRKRLFVSFAIEDEVYRDHLKDQARNHRSPFDFIDMSAKRAWVQAEWKRRCRTRIKGCDGVIVLLSKKTLRAAGAKWEIRCAIEEEKKILGIFIRKGEKDWIPNELKGFPCQEWTWKNLEAFINGL